jgi:predicted TIM-barrel fold metal-dependent hydrolase
LDVAGQSIPLVDYHQHLFRPAPAGQAFGPPAISGTDLIKLLDQARTQRAVVLSVAYQFGNPNKPPLSDEFEKVKAENDWTSREVAQYPDRLRGFCGVNPLKNYALEEITRCAKDPQLRFGLKLHFGNSDVDLENPAHIARVQEVFRAANTNRMAIVVHMRPSVTRKRPYGASLAQKFLTEVVAAAPDVPIQIAHLAGAGGYDNPAIDEALGVFIQAIKMGDTRMTHVYFDVSGVAGLGRWEEMAELIAKRIRQLGIHRVLYGSDGAVGGNTPAEALAAFRRLPLTEAEFGVIQSNVPPYMR